MYYTLQAGATLKAKLESTQKNNHDYTRWNNSIFLLHNTSIIYRQAYSKQLKKMHKNEQNTRHHICTFPTATTSSTTVSAIIIIAVASVVWRGETK
jgi:hypothetical protein